MYPAATTLVSPSKKNSESVFDECSDYQRRKEGPQHLVASAQTNPYRLSEQVVGKTVRQTSSRKPLVEERGGQALLFHHQGRMWVHGYDFRSVRSLL